MSELTNIISVTLREKRDVALAVTCGFSAGLAGVALLASSGYLISQAALSAQMVTLVVLGACLKLFGLAAAISRYGERLFSHRATFTMLSHLRSSFFDKLAPLAPRVFQQYRSGDLLSRIVGDVESLQNFLLRVLYPPVVLLLVFTSTIFFTSFFSLSIALVLLAGMLLTVFIIPGFAAWRKKKSGSAVRESRAMLSSEAAEFLYGFRDLKIYRQAEAKERRLGRFAEAYEEENRKEALRNTRNQSVNSLAAMLTVLAVLALGAYFVTTGELEGLYLAMLVMISLALFENIAPMAVFPSHSEESRKAAVRLESITSAPVPDTGTGTLQPGQHELAADHLSYTYPEEERPALKEVSLRIAPGTKTAIVGPSGSGKSTLLYALLGILPPDSGAVTIDGRPLGSIDSESLWRRMNVVLQDNHFFYGTIRSNLLIADGEATDAELEEALGRVRLGAFPLSHSVEEKGGNLSGGEKQRLAIARAWLRGGSLWLLDEPVSSVDAATARAIYAELFQKWTDDTFVIISHDLSGLEGMDQIIVMDGGRVVETGSYAELMHAKGYFYGLKEIEKSVFA
ncbi:thiol reductant ABC exporter subunit CydC [Planococcus lenghuensis]|uniref:Thiol reductant ABC exporter subunit CydC n=1 Tax=Planococcus lenghuensis TaxID=2213202 RepID=A0A1Q2L2D5_9BACL|nr:thiol reductant ABC exporter subunit CydC [Planococcus lenghuensis]AQQ54601.1 thiol reductant ABC exporter subunit CydC [Planococcus lenghuensis]